MGDKKAQAAWALTGEQHNMITRAELLELGYSSKAIRHKVARGRLHAIWPGVYSVGTPHPTRLAMWMGAVLACGESAALSHDDTAALLGLLRKRPGPIHVSVLAPKNPKGRGLIVHRRAAFAVTT